MPEIIVKTQKELDKIKPDFRGTIYIEGGTYEVPLVFSKKFDTADVIARGTAYLVLRNDVTVRQMRESSTVRQMWESSTVAEMWESSTVAEMWGSSTVAEMWGSSTVRQMRESSTVRQMWESSTVAEMWESSTVAEMWESSTVAEMWGSSTVRQMRGSSTVRQMWGSSTVRQMWGSSTVADLYGEAMVSAYGTQKLVCHGYNIIRTSGSNKKNLTLVMNKESHLIVIPDFKPTFDEYAKRYPVVVKGKKATLYKAVHKKEGKYLSDYNRSFEYVIGKSYEHVNAPQSDGSCAPGLHISHLSWAIGFGLGWDNVAYLECETAIADIVVCQDCDGKVRTSKLKVIREVDWEGNPV